EVRAPEVTPQQARVEAHELRVQRAIEAQLAARVLDLLRVGLRAQDHGDRIAGDEMDEQEHDGDDDQHDGHQREEATKEVGGHGDHAGAVRPEAYAVWPGGPRSSGYLSSQTLWKRGGTRGVARPWRGRRSAPSPKGQPTRATGRRS